MGVNKLVTLLYCRPTNSSDEDMISFVDGYDGKVQLRRVQLFNTCFSASLSQTLSVSGQPV